MYKELCKRDAIEWTDHASKRMLERIISRQDVKTAIMTGEVIEVYPDDQPYASCLILGANDLHVVISVGDGKLWIVTAYRPSSDKWESDLKTRKKVLT